MKEEAAELAWPGAPGADFDMPPPQETVPTIRVVTETPADLQLEVESPGPFTLRMPRIFFPGWRAWVAGKPADIRPSGPWGVVTVELPAGSYPVRVRFGETPLRAFADVVSLMCLVIWVIGLVRERAARPFLVATVVALALLGGLSFRYQGLGRGPHHPTAFPANLQDEIFLLGYELPKTTFQAGGTLGLRLYWLARQTPDSNYRIFLHLVTPDDSKRVAQSDEGPNLDTRPTGRWQAGELVISEQELPLPAELPPGTYRLLLGMYRAEDVRNLPVRSAPAVLPGDRLDLGLIEVRGMP
jgi:hypothetical protein